MNGRRHLLIWTLLLLPLAGGLTSMLGLPACCRNGACPMTATRMAHDMSRCGQQPRCSISSLPQLQLPAPMMPVAPLPARSTGIPILQPLRYAFPVSRLLPLSGWRLPAFHPPNL